MVLELNVKHIHIPNNFYTFDGVYEYICVWHLILKFHLVSFLLYEFTYLNRLRNGSFTILLNEI